MRIVDSFVVASGHENRSRALPGLQALAENQFIVAYRDASVHPVGEHEKIDDGIIKVTRSFDGAKNWEPPSVVWQEDGWDCAGSRTLTQTPFGMVMFVFKAKRSGLKQPISKVQIIVSNDNGYTWAKLGSEIDLYADYTEMNTSGYFLTSKDKGWIVPIYGADLPGGCTYPAMAKSFDQGVSWGKISSIKTKDEVELHETSVVKMDDGRYIGIIRNQTDPYYSYRAYSEDDCISWSSATRLPFRGQTPTLIKLDSGILLCAYRNMDPNNKGVSCSLSYDNGKAWEDEFVIYKSTDFNCGYPALALKDDNEILCVYYTEYDKFGNCDVNGAILSIQ